MHFVTTSKNMKQNPKTFLERFFLLVLENGIKTILHGKMTDKIASEVRPKKGKYCKKCFFFKAFFDHLAPWGVKKMYHIKFKKKISYLGEKLASYLGKWLSNCMLKRGHKKGKKRQKSSF